jgi:hypothetical protein
MKTYKVERVYDEEGEPVQDMASDVVNLVNIEDDTDIIWCAPDEFKIGSLVTEDDFTAKKCNYVDDVGVGSAEFAFKKVEE